MYVLGQLVVLLLSYWGQSSIARLLMRFPALNGYEAEAKITGLKSSYELSSVFMTIFFTMWSCFNRMEVLSEVLCKPHYRNSHLETIACEWGTPH